MIRNNEHVGVFLLPNMIHPILCCFKCVCKIQIWNMLWIFPIGYIVSSYTEYCCFKSAAEFLYDIGCPKVRPSGRLIEDVCRKPRKGRLFCSSLHDGKSVI